MRFSWLRVAGIPLWVVCLLGSVPARAAEGDLYYVDATYGDDAHPGTEDEPWLTLQHAASRLIAGETVKVRPGVYSALALSYPASSIKAVKPANSGTAEAPITFEAEVAGTAIIDQQHQGAGFLILGKDYITIRGFEMRNLQQAGVWTTVDGETGIIVENNLIHTVDGAEGTNVGAVKLDACRDCLVRDNTLHDVRVDGEYYVNGAGVHSYDMANTRIENNQIWNAYTGVFHKRATGEAGIVVDGNLIHHVTLGVLLSVGGTGDPAHVDPQVINNTFQSVETGISTTTTETQAPSRGLLVQGNYFEGGNAVLLWGMDEAVIVDNEFSQVDVAIRTIFDETRPSTLRSSDFNFFPGDATFVLDEWSGQRREFSSLAQWQEGAGLDLNSSLDSRPSEPPEEPEEPDAPPPPDIGEVGAYFADLLAALVGATRSTLECVADALLTLW